MRRERLGPGHSSELRNNTVSLPKIQQQQASLLLQKNYSKALVGNHPNHTTSIYMTTGLDVSGRSRRVLDSYKKSIGQISHVHGARLQFYKQMLVDLDQQKPVPKKSTSLWNQSVLLRKPPKIRRLQVEKNLRLDTVESNYSQWVNTKRYGSLLPEDNYD